MIKFNLPADESEKIIRFQNYLRPAKYLIPAAIFAAILAVGCEDTGAGTGTGTEDDTVNTTDDGTSDGASAPLPLFKTPVELALNGALSSFNYYIFQPALADMDADGDLDVYLGSQSSFSSYYSVSSNSSYTKQSVSFYRNGSVPIGRGISPLNFNNAAISNLPDNTFAGYSSSPVGPMFTAAGDIDGDGDIEIISAGNYMFYSSSSRAALFTYDSGGRTSPTQFSTFLAPSLVDLDNDADLDLVIGKSSYHSSGPSGAYYDTRIEYMLNGGDSSGNGDGIFYPFTADGSILASSPDSAILPIPAFVDVDGDGDQDMFVTEYYSGGTQLTFYRNTGTASVHSFEQQIIPSDFSILIDSVTSYYPAFGDVEDDGDIDIIVGTDDARLLFFENTTVD